MTDIFISATKVIDFSNIHVYIQNTQNIKKEPMQKLYVSVILDLQISFECKTV